MSQVKPIIPGTVTIKSDGSVLVEGFEIEFSDKPPGFTGCQQVFNEAAAWAIQQLAFALTTAGFEKGCVGAGADHKVYHDEADVIYDALIEIGNRIEACGASPELTHAVSLCSDLSQAIGNDHNAPDMYALARVLEALEK